MLLSELIEQLSEIKEELDGRDVEVNVATQPSYPLKFEVVRVSLATDREEIFLATEQHDELYAVSSEAWGM
ncbi:hypothetical protein [Streptomyces sp. CoH17]|uniref:hypothetical protein n=1 Tax=Streptomyces sp. CoH17 TaxID=2992806 RepID=UPI002270F098|nr:hypothetical protein [Streptomyces sp. CoH17]